MSKEKCPECQEHVKVITYVKHNDVTGVDGPHLQGYMCEKCDLLFCPHINAYQTMTTKDFLLRNSFVGGMR